MAILIQARQGAAEEVGSSAEERPGAPFCRSSGSRWLPFVALPFIWAGLAGCTGEGDAAPGPAAADGHTHHPESEADWAIAVERVAWGVEEGLAQMEMGEAVIHMAASFVGTPYEPGTLELPGEERLVVKLEAFDCVTLIEHVLVLTRLARLPEAERPGEGAAFRDRYRMELTGIRYRDGQVDGYPSRLHYFTDWLDQGIAQGALSEVTDALGGIVDERPIHFMSSNTQAYRQLEEDPALVEEIRVREERLSAGTRLFIPQERIREVEAGIRDGDIIAAVSSLEGLDIAHTGFAVHRDGRLHLLHAPLVGDSVEISDRPLAERIQGISAQVGIRVVRPNH